MRRWHLPLAVALVLGALSAAAAQYGDIRDLKLLKPEDKEDVKPTPPPPGAVVLFDGKHLDAWVKVGGKGGGQEPAKWKLVEGGAMEAQGGNIMTKERFAGKFKLHVE